MKARPRSVERSIAEYLSIWFEEHGFESIERIPVLGRTGPDLSIEPELKLVIDVKSRASISLTYFFPAGTICRFGDLIGARLSDIEKLGSPCTCSRKPSTVVDRWMAHMAEWLPAHCRNGIPALILHRPGMWIANSTLLIPISYQDTFQRRLGHDK